MLLIRWKDAVDCPLVRQLMEVLPALAFLLHAQSRESTFRELERSKQQWEAAFDSLRDPLFVYDTERRLQKVNLALAKRLGVSPRDVITQPELFEKHFGEVLTLSPQAPQWSSRTLDATFEVQCADVYDREQRLTGWIYILRDVSDRVRLESQMRQSEKLAALGEMVSGIAHELNNPLTSIVGFAEMLVQSDLPTPESARNRIRKIGMEADRAALIVQNMLAFVRPPSSNQAPLSLNEVVQQVADLRTDMLESQQVHLKLDLEQSLPLVKGCVHELQQVLLNLIDNAIHAIKGCQNQGQIVITTKIKGENTLTLTVQDNGTGILPEHRDKLLLPFFTTKRVGEGSGLGLSISYGILRSHGAILDIQSEAGKGAAFIMEFQAFSPPLQRKRLELSDAPPSITLKRRRKTADEVEPLRIVVLDDEVLVLDLIAEMLQDAGHHVDAYSIPAHAFSALKKEEFDLILCDIRMPEMSGMEFYSELAKHYPNMLSRIIYLTGDVLAPETRRFLESNSCPHLNKPFKMETLRKKITEVMRSLPQPLKRAA
jgi:two-component system NtrC family sensor kinase